MNEQNNTRKPLSVVEIEYIAELVGTECADFGDLKQYLERAFVTIRDRNARIAELESQQDALLEGQDQERLESPAPVQSPCGTCGNPWNQCECGDAPKPSASVEEMARELAEATHNVVSSQPGGEFDLAMIVGCELPIPTLTDEIEALSLTAITEATAPLEVEVARLREALEAVGYEAANQAECYYEDARQASMERAKTDEQHYLRAMKHWSNLAETARTALKAWRKP